jgi:5-methylcytosine-specific restriction endonuclease McrA
VDHIIPLADGGREDDSNRQALCAEPCHREKTEREGIQRGKKY